VILLDTHVWVWWVHGDVALPSRVTSTIGYFASEGLAVSAISCWEVAKLVERGRLQLPTGIHEWMDLALDGSGVIVVPLAPSIAIASSTLPGTFHRDPADQIIVATSRVYSLPLVTCDQKIRNYPHVRLADDAQIHDR
jgi:PIN domain nuclease of toxin-antitoxin system